MRLDRGKARAGGRRAWRSRWRSASPKRAEGIVRIIDVKMEEAIKAISTMRGHDLRDFMLLAFGGAGPVHAGAHRPRSRHGRRDRAALSRRLFGDRPADVRRQARLYPLAHDAARRAHARRCRTPCSRSWRRRRATICADDGFADRAKSASSARSTCAMPARATRSRSPARPTETAALAALRQTFDAQHKSHVRPHGARGAGRGRVLSGARHRPRAGGRDAEIQAAGRERSPTRCAKRGRCASTARRSTARSISAKGSMSGLTLRGPAILDQFDCTTVICAGPDRARRRVEEFDRDGGAEVTICARHRKCASIDASHRCRRSRSGQGEPRRHRAGDAELAVPHRLLHHRARIAGRLLRADERAGRRRRPARRAAAAYRRLSGLLRAPCSRIRRRRSPKATPS